MFIAGDDVIRLALDRRRDDKVVFGIRRDNAQGRFTKNKDSIVTKKRRYRLDARLNRLILGTDVWALNDAEVFIQQSRGDNQHDLAVKGCGKDARGRAVGDNRRADEDVGVKNDARLVPRELGEERLQRPP